MDVNNSAEPAKAGSAVGSMCALTIGSHPAEHSVNCAMPWLPPGRPYSLASLAGVPSGRASLLGSNGGAAGFSPASHRQFRLMPVALPRAAEWNRRIADWLAA
jgi:hypothetical protein